MNEETRQSVENPVNKVMREGLVVGLANHTLLVAKDGTEHPIADSGAPIRDREGTITGVVLVFRDQTQQRAAQKLLVREKERAQQYLDLAGTMLIGLDTSGNVTLVNRKGCEVLGYREKDIIGKNWFEQFLPAESVNRITNIFSDIVASNMDTHKYVENFVQTKNGDARLIAWYNSTVRSDDGSIVGTLSSGEDITDRRRAQEALRESESRYRATFDNASVGMDLVDRRGDL